MNTLDNRVISALRRWLGDKGLGFFRACKKYHGKLDPVMSVWTKEDTTMDDAAIKRMAEPGRGPKRHLGNGFGLSKNYRGPLPHPVHFREGMQVRNFLRSLADCREWSDHDFENYWVKVVEEAIR